MLSTLVQKTIYTHMITIYKYANILNIIPLKTFVIHQHKQNNNIQGVLFV